MVRSQVNKQIITLYDYQQTAFDKLVYALKTTFRALMVMATGLGKTFVSIEVVKKFITPKDKVLFLCHDNGILNKAYKDYKKHVGDAYTYAKFYGEEKDWEADQHHFVFATFQSVLPMLRNKDAKKKLFSPKHFSFIVVDESHHAQAETFAEVINYFKPKYKLGMTATPDREDQADIRDIFGKEIVDIRLPEAVANNWLTPIDYKVLSDGLDEDKIREVCKEVMEDNIRLTEKQINEKIFIKVRTEEQCKIVRKYSKTQKAIVFCENIEHLQHVASILPSSVTIHSEQSAKVNDFNFDLFENGHVQHVIVVDKFNEGIDIPDTELLVFLRATNSERIFLQQLGRGLRPAKGKNKVTVLDFVANIDRIKQVAKFVDEIKSTRKPPKTKKKSDGIGASLHVEGKGFNFDFSNQVVNLLSVFEKIKSPFYETLAEVKVACQRLGIKNGVEYKKRYKEDRRLVRNLHERYTDFPGWIVFFERRYSTWQEASRAAVSLKINTSTEYVERYQEDEKLPTRPHKFYVDFPGWTTFLDRADCYQTWQEASLAVKKLGIKSVPEYHDRYQEDSRLPSSPLKKYPDLLGWTMLFTGKEKEVYSTWQEASRVAIKLEAVSAKSYKKIRKTNTELPSHPEKKYTDFPGWLTFLGKA